MFEKIFKIEIQCDFWIRNLIMGEKDFSQRFWSPCCLFTDWDQFDSTQSKNQSNSCEISERTWNNNKNLTKPHFYSFPQARGRKNNFIESSFIASKNHFHVSQFLFLCSSSTIRAVNFDLRFFDSFQFASTPKIKFVNFAIFPIYFWYKKSGIF